MRHVRRGGPRALLLALLLAPGLARGDGGAKSAARADLARVAEVYAIEVIAADPRFPVPTGSGPITGRVADPRAVERYAALFVPEFTLYPPALIERVGLRRVVLCADLAFAGQRRNAVPDFEHDTLYLDVERGTHAPDYLRAVVHHEFFHMVDVRDDGELYRDEAWAALNPPGFAYGSGGRDAQGTPTTSLFTDAAPGFLTHYGTTGVEEDKAELFAHLLVHPAHVAARAESDRVLAAKVARLQEQLAAFCPEADAAFWAKARRREPAPARD